MVQAGCAEAVAEIGHKAVVVQRTCSQFVPDPTDGGFADKAVPGPVTVPHPVDTVRARPNMAAGVEGQSELIEAVFDTGQRVHRLVPILKDRHHVVAVPEVGVDA